MILATVDVPLDRDTVFGTYRDSAEPVPRAGIAINGARPQLPPRRDPCDTAHSHSIVAFQPLQSTLLHDQIVAVKREPEAEPEPEMQEEEEEVKEPDDRHRLHILFDYLKRPQMDKIRLLHSEVVEELERRYVALREEVVMQRPQIEAAIDAFIRKLIFDILRQDKSTNKVEKVLREFDALYKSRQDEDRLNAHLSARCHDSLTPESDALYVENSKQKRKGRKPNVPNQKKPNEIEQLTIRHISSKTGKSKEEDMQIVPFAPLQMGTTKPTVDDYDVTTKVLRICNACVPKANNHGALLYGALNAVRVLRNEEWPLRRLLYLMQHVACCVSISERVVLEHDAEKQHFFCCYSGELLESGEEVYMIKLIEKDTEDDIRRHIREKKLTLNHFKTPLFREHIHVFFMRRRYRCLASLFYEPLEAQKTAKRVRTPRVSTNGAMPPRQLRMFALSHRLIALVSVMRDLEKRQLTIRLFHNTRIYANEKKSLFAAFDYLAQSDDDLAVQLPCLARQYIGRTMSPIERDRRLSDSLVACFTDVVLDLIDAFYPRATTVTGAQTYDESVPPLLRRLFAVVDERGARREVNAFTGKADLIDVMEFRYLPFFFIILFAYVHDDLQQPLPWREFSRGIYDEKSCLKYLEPFEVFLRGL